MVDFGALLNALSECKNALIFGHSHPDGDCVGSAVSLAYLIEALGGKAKIMFPEESPLRLKFLLGEREELTALPEDLDDYDIICVDVASPTQLGDIKSELAGKVKLRIDHHEVGVPYADTEFVDASAAAAGEIIFDLFEYAVLTGKIKQIPESALIPLFGAISSDTGCFKFANVTPDTHIRAAKLIKYGAPAPEINRLLFDTKSISQLHAEGIANSNLETFADGKISAIGIDLCHYENGLTISDFETAIDIARSVRGVHVAMVAKAAPVGGVFRVSLRSNDGTDVSAVAAFFGGGGHIRAAGCSVEADTAKEAIEKVVAELLKAMK